MVREHHSIPIAVYSVSLCSHSVHHPFYLLPFINDSPAAPNGNTDTYAHQKFSRRVNSIYLNLDAVQSRHKSHLDPEDTS